VHRIGRTGRAGSEGAAVSLVDAEEMGYLKDIERLIKRGIARVEVEGFVPPERPAGHLPERDERPPRQGRPGGGGQNRGQGRGQQAGRPGKPAGTPPRAGSGGAKPAGPKPAASPQAPRPATPSRRESHNRPTAALFSPKGGKVGS
jgi:ATP-dependent RNA helicase RhlE